MTRDDVQFLAAAESAATRLCIRASRTNGANAVMLSHDELSEVALAFDRAVQIAIDAHLATGRRAA